MIDSMYSIPFIRYEVQDWQVKKEKMKSFIREDFFVRNEKQNFLSDRKYSKSLYLDAFCNIFGDDLNQFGQDLNAEKLKVVDIWTVKYEKDDFHMVHNHRSKGFSSILYFDFDENEHPPTIYVGPNNDPITDTTLLISPFVKEGLLTFVPSNLLHFTNPNKSNKVKTVISFDVDIE